jgi:hypothetical protein
MIIFLYLEMDKDEVIDKETTGILFEVATWLTMIGTGTMIIAFVTGTCSTFIGAYHQHLSHWSNFFFLV